MRHLLLAISVIAFGVSACSTTSDEASRHSFTKLTFGEVVALKETRPQQGSRTLPKPTSASFSNITIAQGSGRDGFDAIRIFSDGTGYAVITTGPEKAERVPLQLSPQQLTLLLRAIDRDHLHRIQGMYSAGFSDGGQGFVELVATSGKVRCWLDNYFLPVSNVYDFCNEQAWPKVFGTLPSNRMLRHVDPQEEYYRIFENGAKPPRR